MSEPSLGLLERKSAALSLNLFIDKVISLPLFYYPSFYDLRRDQQAGDAGIFQHDGSGKLFTFKLHGPAPMGKFFIPGYIIVFAVVAGIHSYGI